MKHVSSVSHSFLSDDGRLGIYVEMEGGKVVAVVLTKKSGPKAELKDTDLPQLAEVAKAASDFLNELNVQKLAVE